MMQTTLLDKICGNNTVAPHCVGIELTNAALSGRLLGQTALSDMGRISFFDEARKGRLTDEVCGIALQSLGEGPVPCWVLCQPAAGLHIVAQGVLGGNSIATSLSPVTCHLPDQQHYSLLRSFPAQFPDLTADTS
jgi:hypothetical protein